MIDFGAQNGAQNGPKTRQKSRRKMHHFFIRLGPELDRSWGDIGPVLGSNKVVFPLVLQRFRENQRLQKKTLPGAFWSQLGSHNCIKINQKSYQNRSRKQIDFPYRFPSDFRWFWTNKNFDKLLAYTRCSFHHFRVFQTRETNNTKMDAKTSPKTLRNLKKRGGKLTTKIDSKKDQFWRQRGDENEINFGASR